MSNDSNKGSAFVWVLLLLALFLAVFFFVRYNNGRKEITELKATKTALINDTILYYKAKSGQLVAQVEKITLEKKEIDSYNSRIKSDLKNMKIKLREAELYISANVTNVVKPPDIPLRDTIYIENDKPVEAKTFEWHDNYGGMGGRIIGNSVLSPYYYSKDTLTLVGTKIFKYKFLGLRFKVIGAELRVTNKNPNSTITAPEYIKLK